MLRVKKLRELSRGILGYIRSHLWVSIMGSMSLLILVVVLIFAVSYLLLLKQPMLVIFVPGAANVFLSKLIDPILDQHMPKKEG